MSTAVQTRTREPRIILNTLAPRVPHLVTDVDDAALLGAVDLHRSLARRVLRVADLAEGSAVDVTAVVGARAVRAASAAGGERAQRECGHGMARTDDGAMLPRRNADRRQFLD